MQERTLSCYRAYSNIDELYRLGSCGGTTTTLAYVALKEGLADGFYTLDRTKGSIWQLATELEDLKRACGSTYAVGQRPGRALLTAWVSGSHIGNYGMIGRPCDLIRGSSPKLAIFCARAWRGWLTKEEIPQQSRLSSLARLPLGCTRFLCYDHVGEEADISIGDSQTDKKVNVVIVRTELGARLFNLAVSLNYLAATRLTYKEIKERQPYLWRSERV